MSVARCREINARLRAAGIVVHEWPGWESRGNGQSSAYEGGLVHHTATAFGNALPDTGVGNLLVLGRSDLAGPLCNYAGNADGSITVIAAHPANHAGASGGRSMGPLPVTTLFNKRVLGLEVVYPGTEPMRTAQYRAALIWARVVADVVGFGDIQRVRAHAETSVTGKWDPGDAPGRTINMTAFRAATRIQPEDPAVKNLILAREKGTPAVWLGDLVTRRWIPNEGTLKDIQYWIGQRGGDATVYEFANIAALGAPLESVVGTLTDDEANVLAAVRALPAPGDVDEQTLAAALAPVLAPLISAGATPEQVREAVRAAFARAGQPEGN